MVESKRRIEELEARVQALERKVSSLAKAGARRDLAPVAPAAPPPSPSAPQDSPAPLQWLPVAEPHASYAWPMGDAGRPAAFPPASAMPGPEPALASQSTLPTGPPHSARPSAPPHSTVLPSAPPHVTVPPSALRSIHPPSTPPPINPGHANSPHFTSPPPPIPHLLPPSARTPIDVEKVLGARWLARAGVLVLALGVVFFLKLAYDREWVPIVGRFLIALVAGLAIFAVGDILRKRRIDPAFAQILAGGGALISYVTIYLAWVFPDYRAALHLSLEAEVTMLAAMSATLGAYSVWRNLPYLAGTAVVLSGVLIAPAGAFSTVGLLYVAFLDIAFMLAAARRGWGPIILTASFAANVAHLLALANGVDWRLVAASSAVVNILTQFAAHRARQGEAEPSVRHLAGALGGPALFLTLGLALSEGGIQDPWGWAALAVALLALAGAILSSRIAPVLGPLAGVGFLTWPTLHFAGDLAQVLAYVGLGVAAWSTWEWMRWRAGAARRVGTPALASTGPSHSSFSARLAGVLGAARWVAAFATAAAACGAVSLLAQAAIAQAAQVHPWQAGGLAIATFALGAGIWVRGRALRRPETPMGGLVVAAALLVAWPFLQFEGSLWQTFTLALAATALSGLAIAWAPESRTVRTVAALAAAAAVGSLLVLDATQDASALQPIATGALAILLFAAGGSLWVAGREDDGDILAPVGGLGVATAMLVLWPFLQFPGSLWQTFTLAVATMALCTATVAWPSQRRTARSLAALAAGAAVFSLLTLEASHGASQAFPWSTGALAVILFGAGGAVWALGRDDAADIATPVAGLAVAAAMLFVWPFAQFPGSLWQTFTLATAASFLVAAGLAWPPGRAVLHHFAAAAGALGVVSLFVLAGGWDAVRAHPLGAGGNAALLLALGAGLWWASRRHVPALPFAAVRWAGIVVAGLTPMVYLGFLLDGWGIAVAWAMEGLLLAAAGLLLRDMEVRVASFATFGLVLGRIFLVDFQSLDLPFRVLTFVCTGALLLLASYLFARQRREGPTRIDEPSTGP